jgi:hypothetical protein
VFDLDSFATSLLYDLILYTSFEVVFTLAFAFNAHFSRYEWRYGTLGGWRRWVLLGCFSVRGYVWGGRASARASWWALFGADLWAYVQTYVAGSDAVSDVRVVCLVTVCMMRCMYGELLDW